MAKIIQLEKHVAELIAAGEVVERPASVVKELVENSIDAGATAVTVEIRRGGNSLIRISDNGIGIAKEDVTTSFLRHATSKVRTEEDLNNIGTLGFRGEALASICAVSKVTMNTRTVEEQLGTKIQINGGEIEDISDSGHSVGTTITIKDLFYNTPARMKFLKSDITEANAVAAYIDRLALSHVEISFKFIRDGKTTLFTPGDNQLISAVYTIFGKEFSKSLIPVEYSMNNVTVKGLVSKPEYSRGSRSMQYFFVNDRFVKTNTGQVALEEAYKNEIMQRKFPACVLFIYLNNEMVDVNTHPAKIEVRFVDEKSVYNAVYCGVKNVLSKIAPPPSIDIGTQVEKVLQKNESMAHDAVEQLKISSNYINNNPNNNISEKINKNRADSLNQNNIIYNIPKEKTSIDFIEESLSDDSSSNSVILGQPTTPYIRTQISGTVVLDPVEDQTKQTNFIDELQETNQNYIEEQQIIEMPQKEITEIKFIGEAFSTYIIAQTEDGIMLVDKHAAHERIMFENLKSNKDKAQSQLLLQPVSVNLPKDEYSLVLENSLELAHMGIMVDDFGSGTIIVREFPIEMENADIVSIIEEIASNLRKGKKNISPNFLDELYHSISCKAAIKGNIKSTDAELKVLLEMLMENGEIKHCPHGRPVAVMIEKKEIEKKFGRIV